MMCEVLKFPRRSRREDAYSSIRKGELCEGEGFPIMVELPAGEFVMGENEGDKFANDTERPAHHVGIVSDFALSKFPVTSGEFKKFRKDHLSGDANNLP